MSACRSESSGMASIEVLLLQGIEHDGRLPLGILVVELPLGPMLLGTQRDHAFHHVQRRGVGGRVGPAGLADDQLDFRKTPYDRVAGLEVGGGLGDRHPRHRDRHVQDAAFVQRRHVVGADLGEVVGRQGQRAERDEGKKLPAPADDEEDRDRSSSRRRSPGSRSCQATPITASRGNRPAPTIKSAENDHMAKFRRGISQVSHGL